MITVWSMALGMVAGVVFAAGWGLLAGLLAGASQILDGVDGQYRDSRELKVQQEPFSILFWTVSAMGSWFLG